MRLVEEIRFAQTYSFKYSIRPGTPAARWKTRCRKQVKDQRLQRLQERAERRNRSNSTAP